MKNIEVNDKELFYFESIIAKIMKTFGIPATKAQSLFFESFTYNVVLAESFDIIQELLNAIND